MGVYKYFPAKVKAANREVVSNTQCFQRCDYIQYEFELEHLRERKDMM